MSVDKRGLVINGLLDLLDFAKLALTTNSGEVHVDVDAIDTNCSISRYIPLLSLSADRFVGHRITSPVELLVEHAMVKLDHLLVDSKVVDERVAVEVVLRITI